MTKLHMSAEGTVWEKLLEVLRTGRLPLHNIFKDVPGPTKDAKRNIMNGSANSAFSLIIDNNIMENVHRNRSP